MTSTDPINEIRPGTPVSDEQKRRLAESNEKETSEAQRLAAEHTARDVAEGRGTPVVATIADALKRKLENGDILPPEAGTKSHTHQ